MKDFIKEWWFAIMVAMALASFVSWIVFIDKPRMDAEREARQSRINAFYAEHNCRPEGYVASKYEPIRTYRCDNGVYVASDMAN